MSNDIDEEQETLDREPKGPMTAVLKRPGLKPEVIVFPEGIKLADLQHYVEGTVTCPYIPGLNEEGISLWANDEGLILRMHANVAFFEQDWFEPMLLVGPLLLTGHNEEGETIGLTDEQVEKAKAVLTKGEDFLRKNYRSATDGNTRPY
jgi:hypothetical protein